MHDGLLGRDQRHDCTPNRASTAPAPTATNTLTCNCAGTGYSGTTCQTNINDCSSTSCRNGGICEDRVNAFTCNCAGTGFSGTTCQTNVNDCTATSCRNRGVCIDGVSAFTCNRAGTGFDMGSTRTFGLITALGVDLNWEVGFKLPPPRQLTTVTINAFGSDTRLAGATEMTLLVQMDGPWPGAVKVVVDDIGIENP